MRGYCETCRREMNSDDESEWEGECEVCGTDLIQDIHVEVNDDEDDYDDFEAFLQGE